MRLFIKLAVIMGLLAVTSAHAAVVTINFGNGFNDPTPVTPVGGNTGTTLGEQRRILFQAAADIWGNNIVSSVPITMDAQFAALVCGAGGAVLGSAAPSALNANPTLMGGNVLYPRALEDALIGTELDPGLPDLAVTFNSRLDAGSGDCPASNFTGFYYGLDDNAPVDKPALFATVFHEIAHGLGFISTLDPDGSFSQGMPSIYDVFIFDVDDNQLWTEMNSAQRASSATDDPNVVWNGPGVTSQFSNFVTQGSNSGRMRLDAPSSFVPGSSISHFSRDASPDLLMEPLLRNPPAGQTDLTPWLLQDLGYQISTQTAMRSLQVSLAGTGTGSVISNPAGINCGATCSANFTMGTVVSLTATPNAGSSFVGWSGDCSANGMVTMSANRSCTATFAEGTQTLSLNFAGDGSGSVTSIPAGVDCSANCQAGFATGAVVILTDAASAGSVFSGWAGDCDQAGQVTMSEDRSCTATFSLQSQTMPTLTVEFANGSDGRVTSSPAGIDCGADCSEAYPAGTVVTLTATPNPGFVFEGFTGPADCQGGEVTLTENLTCQANFDILFEPRIRLAPLVIDFTENSTQTLTVFNDGGVDLFLFGFGVGCGAAVVCDGSFLTASVPSMTVPLGSSIDVELTVDFTQFDATHVPGTSYFFGFASNDPINPSTGVALVLVDDVIFESDFEAIETGPPTQLRFIDFPSALEVGEAFQFTVQAFDANNNPVDASFTWASADDAIATVNNVGLVTGQSVGEVNIGVMLADDSQLFIQTFLTLTAAESPAVLVAHWMFEDNVLDNSGFGHHGVLNGSASFSAGQFGQALDLRNGLGWVDVASSVLTGNESCSMSVWVRVEQLAPTDSSSTCCNAIFAEDQFNTGALHNNITFQDPIITEWVVAGSLAVSTSAPAIGSWVHYAWTYNSLTGRQQIYAQGSLVAEQQAAMPACGSFRPSTIGAWDSNGDGTVGRHFDGQLDEMRLYDGILSGADVLNIRDVNRVYP